MTPINWFFRRDVNHVFEYASMTSAGELPPDANHWRPLNFMQVQYLRTAPNNPIIWLRMWDWTGESAAYYKYMALDLVRAAGRIYCRFDHVPQRRLDVYVRKTCVAPTLMRVDIVFGRSQADRTLKVAFYSMFSGNLIHTVVINFTRPYKVKDAVAEITQHMLASGQFESNLQTVKLFHGERHLGTGVYLWSPAWCRPGPICGRPTRKTILKQAVMDRYFRRR